MATPDGQIRALLVILARRQRRLNIILGLLMAFDVGLFTTAGLIIYVQQRADSDANGGTARTVSLSKAGTGGEASNGRSNEAASEGGATTRPREHVEEVVLPVDGYNMIVEEAFSDRSAYRRR